jgi:hypothetical protein
MEECRIALFNLVSTGFATPFVHNNSSFYDKDGQPLVRYIFSERNFVDGGSVF